MTDAPEPKPDEPNRWSQHVTETSDAMDLQPDVFKQKDPKAIARSLKASAEHSDRRKSEPYRSAMSMLTFYENRAGHNLPASQRKVLDAAKVELRALFDRPPARKAANKAASKKAASKKAASKKVASKKVASKKAASKKSASKKTAAKKTTAKKTPTSKAAGRKTGRRQPA